MSGSKKRCVVILADGARSDVFEHLLERGMLKNIARHIVEPGRFTKAASVFPSTTGPAYSPYLMGVFPGQCGMPGIRWLDKELWDNPFNIRRIRSYVCYEAAFLNGDLAESPPTLFEIFPSSASIFNEMTRGLAPENNLTRPAISAYWKLRSHFFERGKSIDRVAADKLLSCFERPEEDIPDFCFSVFMQIDSLSHKLHPFHKKVIDAYLELDGIVGEVAGKLREKGLLEQTLVAIVSDHGLTATHTHLDLAGLLEERGFRLLQYPNIFRNFFGADCSVMVSGNAMAHIYFRDPDGAAVGEVAQMLADRRETDIVMSADGGGGVTVLSERGRARIERRGEKIIYETKGGDPFGFENMPEAMSKDEQLSLTFSTEYPDALVQACQIFESSRAGDIVVSAKPGFDLRARFEFPEHMASHGSMATEHTTVPVAINTPVSGREARTVDIYPTILEYMETPVPQTAEGKSLLSGS